MLHMTQLRFARSTFAAILSVPLLAMSSVAGAEDVKTYNAAGSCFARDSSVTTLARSSAGISNTGTTPVAILCPIVKDLQVGNVVGLPGSVAGAWVTYVDNTTTDKIICDLVSAARSGGKVANVQKMSVDTDASATAKVLDMGPLKTVTDGNLVLGCTIPGKAASGALSKVVSYQIREAE